jgi:hypothetical protein
MHRPDKLARFVQAYKQTDAILPIFVIFDANDAVNYNDIDTPAHWKRVTVPAGKRIGEIFNLVFRAYPQEDFYGMVADDVVPQTPHWDIALKENCLPDKISWGCDGIQNDKLPVHPFIGGDLLRKLGWWAAPGLKHWFVDNVWKHLADDLHCGIYLPNIKMTHLHPLNGTAAMDRTYQGQPSHVADEYAYYRFMQNGFAKAVQRCNVSSKTQ